MTATCSLCNAKLESPADPLLDGDEPRKARALQELLKALGAHIKRFHRDREQSIMQLAMFAAACAQSLAILSLVKGDADLEVAIAKLKQQLDRALEPKRNLGVLSTGEVSAPPKGPKLVQST